MLRHAVTIALGAFLLFQVQPIIAKRILPWFGGSAAVWTTCMLFFQGLLLAGYAYAHLLTSRLSRRRHVVVHLVLLAASLAFLPIAPGEGWRPTADDEPTARILLLLLVTIGVPYVVLSSTGPLVQHWFAVTHPGRSPYRLFSLSNAGSLLALVSYPFVFEPLLTQRFQALSWSAAFGVFVLAYAWCGARVLRGAGQAGPAADDLRGATAPPMPKARGASARPRAREVLLWLGLTAFPSMLLLATTNQACQEVAAVPFLWVLPLALYLLTFIACFDHERWYVRGPFSGLLAATTVLLVAWLNLDWALSLPLQVTILCSVLFACCMTCHGELYRSRPAPEHLTLFYLTVAAGGALGGAVAAVAAPRVFADFWELHLATGGCVIVTFVAWARDPTGPVRGAGGKVAGPVLAAFAVFVVVSLALDARDSEEGVVERVRTFHGVLTVTEGRDEHGPWRALRHGRIEHGFQYLLPRHRRRPTSYYGPTSGVGLALRFHPARGVRAGSERPLRIGVVGLGVGTLATYGEEGDAIHFYELDAHVRRLATTMFSYVSDAEAEVEITLGDARVRMEEQLARAEPQRFDVLAVDAFAGDAIPVHLLTAECFRVYLGHLAEDGILAIHVSNHHLDLKPVVRTLAERAGMAAAWHEDWSEEDDPAVDDSDWILVTRNLAFLADPAVRHRRTPWPDDMPVVDWTDDSASLWRVLQW